MNVVVQCVRAENLAKNEPRHDAAGPAAAAPPAAPAADASDAGNAGAQPAAADAQPAGNEGAGAAQGPAVPVDGGNVAAGDRQHVAPPPRHDAGLNHQQDVAKQEDENVAKLVNDQDKGAQGQGGDQGIAVNDRQRGDAML